MKHPWLDEFEANPVESYDRFIRDYAHKLPYDPLNAARLLFGVLEDNDLAIKCLDDAVVAWLDMKVNDPNAIEPKECKRLLREISYSFEIIRTLNLKNSIQYLDQNVDKMYFWSSKILNTSV